MEQQKIMAGDNIIWHLEKGDWLANTLSTILSWKDKTWKARSWKGWHMGYVVAVLSTGEIVTSQAVNDQEGVCSVTYDTLNDMGDCHIYHWLDNPNLKKINQYAAAHNGEKYNVPAYVFVILAWLFNLKINIVTNREMCWENVSEFDLAMGKELQPEDEEPLISKIMNSLEGVNT